MRTKVHLGFCVAAVGYLMAIFFMSTKYVKNPFSWFLSNALHVPLFASLALCLLLGVTGGRWRGPVSRRSYQLVAFLAIGYAGAMELQQWLVARQTASIPDFILDCVGVVGLLFVHRRSNRSSREAPAASEPTEGASVRLGSAGAPGGRSTP